MDVVADIVRSMFRHGARRFLLLDTGVSTHPPLKTLSSELHEELGVLVGVTDITKLGAEVTDELEEQPSGGEGKWRETLSAHADEHNVRTFIQSAVVTTDVKIVECDEHGNPTQAIRSRTGNVNATDTVRWEVIYR